MWENHRRRKLFWFSQMRVLALIKIRKSRCREWKIKKIRISLKNIFAKIKLKNFSILISRIKYFFLCVFFNYEKFLNILDIEGVLRIFVVKFKNFLFISYCKIRVCIAKIPNKFYWSADKEMLACLSSLAGLFLHTSSECRQILMCVLGKTQHGDIRSSHGNLYSFLFPSLICLLLSIEYNTSKISFFAQIFLFFYVAETSILNKEIKKITRLSCKLVRKKWHNPSMTGT